jgi:broad specificity phosphatase PhoE
MDYGPYEGMDLKNPAPELMEFFRDLVHHPAPKGMEPLPHIVSRLGEFLEEIREEAAEQNVLLSTHAIAMKGALEYLTPDSHGSWWSRYIGNCAVFSAKVQADGRFGIPVEFTE